MIPILLVISLTDIPIATVFTTGIAVTVSFLFAIARRKLTDYKRMRRIHKEVKEFNKSLMAARKEGNASKLQKLKRKEKQMKSLQLKMMTENFKSMLYLAPFMIVYFFLNQLFGPAIVAVSPIVISPIVWFGGDGIQLQFIHWYIISSFAFSSLTTKLLGVGMDA